MKRAALDRSLLVPGLPPGWTAGLTPRAGWPSAHSESARGELRAALARALGVAAGDIAWRKQVHGADVVAASSGGPCGEGDALVGQVGGPVLAVGVADCGPLLLWDVEGGHIAACHAGWRGTLAGVVEATVEALVSAGAERGRIAGWLGPCIGACCFEVGEEVAGRFGEQHVLPAGELRPRPHVDLVGELRARLAGSGIEPGRLAVAGSCTHCDPGRFWSYRRDGGIAGRHLAFVHAPA